MGIHSLDMWVSGCGVYAVILAGTEPQEVGEYENWLRKETPQAKCWSFQLEVCLGATDEGKNKAAHGSARPGTRHIGHVASHLTRMASWSTGVDRRAW